MAPIFDTSPICGGTPIEVPCFYYYTFTTIDGADPNWPQYNITSDVFGIQLASDVFNPVDPSGGGVWDYAQALGINGISDWYGSTIGGSFIGGIISYYGTASQQNNYNFIITNSINMPVVTSWKQGFSCVAKCFEHSFQKPDFIVRNILCDSAGDVNLDFLPTGSSPWQLDLSNPADISNFERILQNIYGPQVVVSIQTPPSGNIILRIQYIYTDQITINLAVGSTHVMSEISCG